MPAELRKSGIEVLGDIPWGSHFCQFYETKKDLLELLVPYFKAGLENNEYGLWIIADPMTVDDALHGLKKAVPGFQKYIEKKSIEILPYMGWFMTTGKFNGEQINNAWLQKLDEALERGYDGMRINGNETWLERNGWDNFMEYERGLNRILKNRRIIGLCTYPLSLADGEMVLDVAHAHEAVIAKRKGSWEILEHPEIKKLKTELQQRGDKLELRVAERTHELKQVVEQLKKEIDERKRAEENSRRQAKLTNEIIETIPTMIWGILPDGNLDFVNQRWLNYTGLSLSEAIKDPTSIIHPADFLSVTEKWKTNRDAGNPSEAEMRLRGADGKYRWFLVRTAPLRDMYGNVAKWFGVSIDIAESKAAQDELRLAYQRLSYHVDNSPLAVIEWDRNLVITRWSAQAENIFGWKEAEALGKNIYDPGFHLIYEEDQPRVEDITGELAQGLVNRNFSLNRNYTKDKKVIYCEWYNSVLRDEHGNVMTMLSLTHDVTERKRAEEKLRQSENLLAEAEHVAHVGSWSLDLSSKTVTWSDELYRIFGIDHTEFDNSLKTVIGLVHPADRNFITHIVEEAISTHKPNDFHFRIIGPAGEERILHVRSAVMTDEQGNATRIYGAVQDVTERKKAEESLNESYEEIRSLSEHLRTVREEERKYIAREIHDELGQYLTVLKMDVGSINKKIHTTDEAVRRKLDGLTDMIDKIVHSVRRIASELRPSLLDDLGLAAAIGWHLEEFEKQSGMKTEFLETKEELDLPEPIKTHLFRILQESLTNIARHSQATEVKVDFARNNRELVLTISDNGIGFNPDTLNQKRTLGILGMKERATIIGGNYKIDSTPGKGTRITVIVPLPAKEKM